MEIGKYEDNKNALSLDTLLEILGNPTRRVVLAKLSKVSHSTSELANELGISRQAVHSQLELLVEKGIIDKIESKKGVTTYRIRKDISLRIDISPDYFNIKYNMNDINDETKLLKMKETGCSADYEKIQSPGKKIKFLGKEIKQIEEKIKNLEEERKTLMQDKQCFIIELKNLMQMQYKKHFEDTIKQRHFKAKNIRENLNLIEEIFVTLFFNTEKYYKRIDIDNLIDDIFFTDMDSIDRVKSRVSIEPLLKDLSKMLDVFKEDEDFWFFDF